MFNCKCKSYEDYLERAAKNGNTSPMSKEEYENLISFMTKTSLELDKLNELDQLREKELLLRLEKTKINGKQRNTATN